MPRPTLPAGDPAAHRAWIAETIQAPFHRPRELARLVHPKAEPAPPAEKAPDLVDMMEAPPPADEKPWYVRQRMPLDEMLRAHFGGVISPPTPLAQKRARLRRERAEAALAKMDAEYEEEAEMETLPPSRHRSPRRCPLRARPPRAGRETRPGADPRHGPVQGRAPVGQVRGRSGRWLRRLMPAVPSARRGARRSAR